MAWLCFSKHCAKKLWDLLVAEAVLWGRVDTEVRFSTWKTTSELDQRCLMGVLTELGSRGGGWLLLHSTVHLCACMRAYT